MHSHKQQRDAGTGDHPSPVADTAALSDQASPEEGSLRGAAHGAERGIFPPGELAIRKLTALARHVAVT